MNAIADLLEWFGRKLILLADVLRCRANGWSSVFDDPRYSPQILASVGLNEDQLPLFEAAA